MQGETAAVRVTENDGKLDVFPQNRTPSSGRASAKSWQYRWVVRCPGWSYWQLTHGLWLFPVRVGAL